MSQKVTLSKADLKHLPHIKRMLLEGKAPLAMSLELNLRRETISRKLNKWMRTDDFKFWLREVWIDLYADVKRENKVEAFRQVTRMLTKVLTDTPSLAESIDEIKLMWAGDKCEPDNKDTVPAA